jgi:anti-sigma regulatory factor (Ser/Thr protein kinase)
MPTNVLHPDGSGEPIQVESLRLPALASSVPCARRMASRCLSAWGLDDFVFPCTQVVTELAANAVTATEHTSRPADRGTFTLRLSLTATHLFACVSDASPEPPRPRTATEQDENGRGLALVQCRLDKGLCW